MRALACLICALAFAPGAYCIPCDEISLIQAGVRPWPQIGDIAEKAKQSADAAAKAAQEVNITVQGKLNQAANATKNAIDAIVTTVHTGLSHILANAKVISANTGDAMQRFLTELDTNTDIQTLEEFGDATMEAFNMSFVPLVAALKDSGKAVETVLKASGFLHLAGEVGIDLAAATGPLDATLDAAAKVRAIFEGLDEQGNKTADKISAEVDKNLTKLMSVFRDAMVEVNNTFVTKLTEGYDLLVKHLRSTVSGVLPPVYMDQVNASLNTLAPEVASVVAEVTGPPNQIANTLTEATNRIYEAVPLDPKGGAHGAARLSFLALAAGACATLLRS